MNELEELLKSVDPKMPFAEIKKVSPGYSFNERSFQSWIRIRTTRYLFRSFGTGG